MEELHEDIDISQMKKELASERTRTKSLNDEIRQLKTELVNLQSLSEQEDEYRVNKLSKNLEQLKREKQDLLLQVEQEEEYLINALGRRLEQVRKEKIDLENQLEQEEEFITNKLQKQLMSVMSEKRNLEKRLEAEVHEHERLVKLEQELGELRSKLKQYESEREEYQDKNTQFKDELLKLKTENFVLGQRIKRETEKLSRVSNEKAKLMSNLEMDDERLYNTKGRQIQRTRSTSLPPRAVLPAASPVTPHVAPMPASTPTTPVSVHTHAHSSSLPTTPTSLHPPHPHLNPLSPRNRSSLQKGKILKDGHVRIKDQSHESQQQQQQQQQHHEGWAELRDTGASVVLQVWRDQGSYDIQQPDVILNIDTLHRETVLIEADKHDPRSILIAAAAESHHVPPDLPLSLVFEKDDSAGEWVALLNDLRV